MQKAQHKHWHSRGYLPHCDTPGLLQAVTFRLADSLPAEVLLKLQQEVTNDAEKRKRIEVLLDAGYGACWLKQPEIAGIVENALLHGDGQSYRLLAWCVMPNHVHGLIETCEGSPLSGVLHGWKSFTAKAINLHLKHTHYASASGSANAKNTATANADASISGGTVAINLAGGNVNVSAGSAYAYTSGANKSATATANASINGNLSISAGSLNAVAGSASAYGAGAAATANAALNTNAITIAAGDLNLSGGFASATSGAVADASAKIASTGNLNINVSGNVYLVGGSTSNDGVSTATAAAFIGGYPVTVNITTGGDLGIYSVGLGAYAGIASLGVIKINVGGDFDLVGGPGIAYTDPVWGTIGPGTGMFSAGPLAPIIVTVAGTTTIDTSCLTCAPAFIQTLYAGLPEAVVNAISFANGEVVTSAGQVEAPDTGDENKLAGLGKGLVKLDLPSCDTPGGLNNDKGCVIGN